MLWLLYMCGYNLWPMYMYPNRDGHGENNKETVTEDS